MQKSMQMMTQPAAAQLWPTPTANRSRPPAPSGKTTTRQRLCWTCGSPAHIARNCNQAATEGQQQLDTVVNARGAITPSGFQEGRLPARLIKGGNVVNVYCVLDTGCNYTTVPKKYSFEKIVQTDVKLFAANGEQIPLLGKSRIRMYVGKQLMYIDFVVSESVDEILLSSDFLIDSNVQWDLAKALIVTNGEEIRLRPRTSDVDAVLRCVC